jgi:two-component sensor histidine kinase
VHHRVKNNLLTLYSLVDLQKMSLRAGLSAERALEDTKQRISAMGRVHRMLYLSKSFSEIDFSQYIKSLVDEIKATHENVGCRVKVDLKLRPTTLDIDTAISCGLVINAFVGRKKGQVSVSLEQRGKYHELRISDNGIGIPENPLMKESETLGMKLVMLLTQQIKAKISYKAGEGSLFTIVFKSVTIEPPKKGGEGK